MRRLRAPITTLAAVMAVGLWALFLRPQTLGGPVAYIVIRGTSMLPTYETGDLVVARHEATYAVGDVVAYRVPAGEVGAGHVVVHRIVGGDATSGFLVQGDNNDSVDPWMPRPGDVVGRPVLHVTGIGRVLDLAHQPAVISALAAAIVVSWVIARGPTTRGPAVGASRNARPSVEAARPGSPARYPPSIRLRRSNSSSSISPRA